MIGKNIIAPHITEKTMKLTEVNKYTFLVAKISNKHEIAKEIKDLYKVDPIDVKIININGKQLLFRGRFKGQRKNFKKAIVKLPKTQKIKEFIIKEEK